MMIACGCAIGKVVLLVVPAFLVAFVVTLFKGSKRGDKP